MGDSARFSRAGSVQFLNIAGSQRVNGHNQIDSQCALSAKMLVMSLKVMSLLGLLCVQGEHTIKFVLKAFMIIID